MQLQAAMKTIEGFQGTIKIQEDKKENFEPGSDERRVMDEDIKSLMC